MSRFTSTDNTDRKTKHKPERQNNSPTPADDKKDTKFTVPSVQHQPGLRYSPPWPATLDSKCLLVIYCAPLFFFILFISRGTTQFTLTSTSASASPNLSTHTHTNNAWYDLKDRSMVMTRKTEGESVRRHRLLDDVGAIARYRRH
ncbi:hypothetical protein QR685DRAFT_551946 [Neurospora intermedia]|uniref:Uncharacterized protein n=1 Tax=Neurospora intermedia TaxID=5142 RepID=A0ABR3DF79_NEUIN